MRRLNARTRKSSHLGVNDGEVLECAGLTVRFGGVTAVDCVDLRVEKGELVGLIGPNGAGKTSLMNAVAGLTKPTSGDVFLGKRKVTGAPPRRLARLGIARTFQDGRLFRELSVIENVEIGAVGVGCGRAEARDRAANLLDEIGLREKGSWPAASLAYGEEQRLAIGRALAMNPRFLMLDEPAAGLNEAETDRLHDSVLQIRQTRGCGVLIVEHDMRLMMKLCDRLHVLDRGRTLCVGTPDAVRANADVIAAYLGEAA